MFVAVMLQCAILRNWRDFRQSCRHYAAAKGAVADGQNIERQKSRVSTSTGPALPQYWTGTLREVRRAGAAHLAQFFSFNLGRFQGLMVRGFQTGLNEVPAKRLMARVIYKITDRPFGSIRRAKHVTRRLRYREDR